MRDFRYQDILGIATITILISFHMRNGTGFTVSLKTIKALSFLYINFKVIHIAVNSQISISKLDMQKEIWWITDKNLTWNKNMFVINAKVEFVWILPTFSSKSHMRNGTGFTVSLKTIKALLLNSSTINFLKFSILLGEQP